MSRVRYKFRAKLETEAPLHVGSGEFRYIDTVRGRDGSNEQPLVAAIVRDCDNRPYIPATALKNLSLRTARALGFDTAVVSGLFGQIKSDDGSGGIGTVLFRGAPLAKPGNASAMPYTSYWKLNEDKNKRVVSCDLGAGVFVAARTRINPATGTADDHKLFFQEMVAPGATFEWRMLLEGRDADSAERQAKGLQAILDALTAGGGTLGKGQADGFGRVRVVACSTRVSYSVLSEGGTFSEQRTAIAAAAHPSPAPSPVVRRWRLSLTCDGPFMVLDSSWTPPPRDRNDPRDNGPQLKAQRVGEHLPLLLGSSLSGTLRQRAAWLAALAALRGRAYADATATLDRLFGKEDFRALLQIERLTVESAIPFDITSVKLDRFSGAPIDNALFKSAAFRAVRAEAVLAVAKRPGAGTPLSDDLRLADDLIADIGRQGLELGHGGNKGFGWFNVEVADVGSQ